MKKLRFVSIFGVLVVLLLAVASSAYGGQEKVDVCHITGTHDFGAGEVPIGHVITIADPAYDSHIAHGDPPAHVEVTLPDGTVVCTAEVETPETKTVFVSSGLYVGNLDGLAGADAKCQALADASPLVPEGTYIAWLSTGDGDYASPATGRFEQSSVPYVRVDGVVVADDWPDLTDDSLDAPINLDEDGVVYSGPPHAWTATSADGTYYGGYGDCGEWINEAIQGHLGDSTRVDSGWSSATYENCYNGAHLYCFQQTAPPPYPEPPETKTVFETSGTYAGSSLGGLSGADAVCQGEAEAAGLPGTYKAWLSAAGEGNSAAERLTHPEVPYVRVDGTQVADNWDDLTNGSLDAPISPSLSGGPEVWTGTAIDGSFVSGSSDCDAWMSDTGAAVYGVSDNVGGGWTQSDSTYDCDAELWLYCFEQ